MPSEVRRLVFSHLESTHALIAHGEKMGVALPPGLIIRVKKSGDADFSFHTMARSQSSESPPQRSANSKHDTLAITFFDEATFEHKHVSLTTDFVFNALIAYCADNKIMLPRGADKSLDSTEFNLCIDIKLDTGRNDGQVGGGLALEE